MLENSRSHECAFDARREALVEQSEVEALGDAVSQRTGLDGDAPSLDGRRHVDVGRMHGGYRHLVGVEPVPGETRAAVMVLCSQTLPAPLRWPTLRLRSWRLRNKHFILRATLNMQKSLCHASCSV